MTKCSERLSIERNFLLDILHLKSSLFSLMLYMKVAKGGAFFYNPLAGL
jgi:hypothetical protein